MTTPNFLSLVISRDTERKSEKKREMQEAIRLELSKELIPDLYT